MTVIFDADQADRQVGPKIDWSVVGRRDAARQARTRALLCDTLRVASGVLPQTGQEQRREAMEREFRAARAK